FHVAMSPAMKCCFARSPNRRRAELCRPPWKNRPTRHTRPPASEGQSARCLQEELLLSRPAPPPVCRRELHFRDVWPAPTLDCSARCHRSGGFPSFFPTVRFRQEHLRFEREERRDHY